MLYSSSFSALDHLMNNKQAFIDNLQKRAKVSRSQSEFAFDALVKSLKDEYGEMPSHGQVRLFLAKCKLWLNAKPEDRKDIEKLYEKYEELRG